jgi:hypothetical protein
MNDLGGVHFSSTLIISCVSHSEGGSQRLALLGRERERERERVPGLLFCSRNIRVCLSVAGERQLWLTLVCIGVAVWAHYTLQII